MKHFSKMIVQRITAFVRRLISFVATNATAAAIRNLNSIYSDRWHPHNLLREKALEDTVSYIQTAMPDAMIMRDEFKVLSYALTQVKIDGLFLEFGVRTGNTINHIAKQTPKRSIFGFDSFEGFQKTGRAGCNKKAVLEVKGCPM